MRRLLASRASTAAAGVAAIVVVLAAMVGVAQGLTSGQAGPPTQVFMQTTEGDVEEPCLHVSRQNQSAMHQDLHLDAGSSVVALFSFGLTHLDAHETGIVGIVLTGGVLTGDPRFKSEIWGFPGNANFSNTSGTVTWSFANVPATGDYTVDVRSFLGFPDEPSQEVRQAWMEGCSLTVFVSPPVQ